MAVGNPAPMTPPPGAMYTNDGIWAPSPQGGYYLYADNMGNVNPNPPVAPYTTPVGDPTVATLGSGTTTQPGYNTPGGSTSPYQGNTYVNGVGSGYFENGPSPEMGDRATAPMTSPYQPTPYVSPTPTPSTFGTPAYTPPPPIGAVPTSQPSSPIPGYSPADYAAMSQNFASSGPGTSVSGQQMVNDVNAQNAARNEADMAMWNAMNQYQNQQFGAPIPANPNLPEGMVAMSAGSSYPGTQPTSPVPAGMPVLYPGTSAPTTGTSAPKSDYGQPYGPAAPQTSGGATNGGPVSYTPPAAVPYNNTQTSSGTGPVSFQPPQTFTDYYGQQPGGVAPSVPPGTTGTGTTGGSSGGGNTVTGGLPPIGQPTAPTFNLPQVQPYGQVPGYNGYSYDVGQAPGMPTITPWSPTVGNDGAFAGMPGGQAPQYNFAPLYGQDQIQGMVNQAMGRNAATEAGANRDTMENMAGRGFSTNSAVVGSANNQNSLNRMLADVTAQSQIPMQAQAANAQYGRDMLGLAQGDRQLSQNAWQMATQLPLAYQQLGLQGYSAGQNALNNYYGQLNALGQLNNQNYQTALGGYNAGNQALNDYYQNVLGQGQLGLQGYNSYYDALGQYGNLANQRYGLGLSEQSNNIALFNSLLNGLLGAA